MRLSAGRIINYFFALAFGGFECPDCGKISKCEFSPAERRQMLMLSIFVFLMSVILLFAAGLGVSAVC